MRIAPLIVWILGVGALSSQPAFEVASVKPSTAAEIGGVYTYPGGRVELLGCTLQYLIELAFDMHRFQISGGPGWIQSERYDIDAKPPTSSKSSHSMPRLRKTPPNEEQREMLQSLLVERFQLRYRRESREGSVYLLTRGKNGLKLTDARDKNAYPWAGGVGGGMITGDGLAGINESMEDLARRLSPYLGRPVLDRTGLAGSFDFRFEYKSEEQDAGVVSVIFASLRELGLKLEPAKGSVPTLVIDHVEKPSAN